MRSPRVCLPLICLLAAWAHLEAYAAPRQLPVAFEPNRGQAGTGVEFVGRIREGLLLLASRGARLRLEDGSELTIAPEGANPRPRLTAEEPVAGVSNYLHGNDNSRWITQVPHFRRVRYHDLYPGIDLVFYGADGALEYDLIVTPGADPRAIRLHFRGARKLALDSSGGLRIDAGASHLLQQRPAVYQDIAGHRRETRGRFVVTRDEVRFSVDEYDRTRPLVIDPVLRFGTYLGGHSRDLSAGVAVDSSGSAYLAGYTVSADFPVTPNTLQVKHGGVPNSGLSMIGVGDVFDVFVTKFSPDGSQLVYSTFLGGSRADQPSAIAVDASGNAVVAGSTTSPDFPLAQGAIQKTLPSGFSVSAGFVAKLNRDGSNLIYSTYLSGATDLTSIRALALDAGGVYLAGSTNSPSFPTTANAFQTKLAGSFDGFVTKLNPQGTAIVYSTFLGSKLSDQPNGIAVDSAGNAYIAGVTSGTDFPASAGAAQTTPGGNGDGFISKLNASGTALVFSTLLGGSEQDTIYAIALDRDNSVLVTGSTFSADFPTTLGAFRESLPKAAFHAFVAKLDPPGSINYATLLGGSGSDGGSAIGVAVDGSAIVGGNTFSLDFPLTSDAYQSTVTGTNCFSFTSPFGPSPGSVSAPCEHAFLTIVHVSGRRLVYSTYLGGSNTDDVTGLSLGPDGAIYVTGATGSDDFPTTRGAYSQTRASANCTSVSSPTATTTFACEDAYLLKIDPVGVGPPRPVAAIANGANGIRGPVAPGEFVALFGFGIGPRQPDTARLGADGNLLNTLSGTTVTFNGVPAPLLYVGPNQINAIVPFTVAGKASATVRIDTADYGATVAIVAVASTAPGLFSVSGTGQGQAAALNQDGTINSADNAATRGSVIVLYGTGAGQTNPPGLDGHLATTLSQPLAPIAVTIGGQDAQVLYAGAAPGLVEGVIQVNALIPAGVAPGGRVPVILKAGSTESQASISIAVQ